mgnify:CR=1 FL=1
MYEFARHLVETPVVVCIAGIMLLSPGCSSPSSQPNESSRSLAALSVVIENANTGQPAAVRVRLASRSSGAVEPLPEEAIGVMWGRHDRAEGFLYQPDSSFYIDGSFEAELEPGEYILTFSKGNEYLAESHTFTLAAGDRLTKTYRLERWIDMPARGWYSADDHIHIRRSPREDPHIRDWIAAEDIHVGVLLWMGDFWTTYYQQYDFGAEGIYQEGDHLLTSGQEEPRTPELGHTIGIGASEPVRFADSYYLYDKVFDAVHAHGGMTGYAHQGVTFHGYRGVTLDGLRGKLDVIELMQFCAEEGPLVTDNYYRLLDLGYQITATAGSDFPWCGKGHRYGVNGAPENPSQIGDVRFYTYVGDTLSYRSWKSGLDAGHTFVSSGPTIEFRVNGQLPGNTVDVAPGESVTITTEAFGHPEQVPLTSLEIIGHGETLHSVSPDTTRGSTSHLSVEMDLPIERGIWLAAKVNADRLQVAHTTPVYVRVNGGSFHNPDTAGDYLQESGKYLDDLEQVINHPSDEIDHHAWRYRNGLETRIAQTREVIDSLRSAFVVEGN